jgi:hypothetical protein
MAEALQQSLNTANKDKDALIESCSALKAQLAFGTAEVRGSTSRAQPSRTCCLVCVLGMVVETCIPCYVLCAL